MFCALKGATCHPSCLKMRQSAVAKMLLPADDDVPCIIKVLAVIGIIYLSSRHSGFLRTSVLLAIPSWLL